MSKSIDDLMRKKWEMNQKKKQIRDEENLAKLISDMERTSQLRIHMTIDCSYPKTYKNEIPCAFTLQ
jgi:hypothetical protein